MEPERFEFAFESVRGLLLEMARERALGPLLERVVVGLADLPGVALARVWLVREGDLCDTCAMRADCPGSVPCLHLVASAGHPRADPDADWSRLDGEFRRFPIGQRKVGSVAATTEAVCVEDARRDARWIAHPEWAEREGILGFGGQPLLYRGEVLGVLGVFTRARFHPEPLASLRALADHAAASIANARAFEENQRLRQRLELENEYLRDELAETQAFGEIVGTSPAIREIERQIEQVAPTEATVLILGESGTGKELVAREIHRRSARADGPLIRVNCASVPAELFESEFFGHVKGAFTGAVKERIGRFAAADGGTLLLDEVGEIPLGLQSKLLRVLQEGQYERVGDDRTREASVRVLAATNRDLAAETRAGRFREDLYYRLNVFPVSVPPLRERVQDIALLAELFLARATQKHNRPATLRRSDVESLQRYPWPGNIRELQNAVERAVITARDGVPNFLLAGDAAPAPQEHPVGRDEVLTEAAMRELERANLLAALERCGGKVYGAGGAAELLGMKPTTLASRLQRMGIERSG